jgi:hypothetical protein
MHGDIVMKLLFAGLALTFLPAVWSVGPVLPGGKKKDDIAIGAFEKTVNSFHGA